MQCVVGALSCWKNACCNAADHWQQLLHQQHISVMLSVDFSTGFNENMVSVAEFRYCSITTWVVLANIQFATVTEKTVSWVHVSTGSA